MVTGKRYQVFSIREALEKDGRASWLKAGSAFVNRDGSLNVYLDVLPLDGKLHVREAVDRKDAAGDTRGTEALAEAMPMGGH